MNPADLQQSSEEVQKLTSKDLWETLNYVLKGKTISIQSLRKKVLAQFEAVLDAMSNDTAATKIAVAFHNEKYLSFGQVRNIRKFLRKNFEESGGDEADEENFSEYDNQVLSQLGGKIRKLHVKEWFSVDLIHEFVTRGSEFVDAFLFHYLDDIDEVDEAENGGIKIKTKKPGETGRGGETFSEKNQWDDDDDQLHGFLQGDDIVTLRILFSCIDSFLSSLKRKIKDMGLEDASKDENIRKMINELNPLVQKLKRVTYMSNIRDSLADANEYYLNDYMLKVTKKWDSYRINM